MFMVPIINLNTIKGFVKNKISIMYKIILNTLLVGSIMLLTGCSGNKSVKLIESWKVGTSSGLFTDFSQKEFDEFKSNGIDYIELGSGFFGKKTQVEKEALAGDLKQKADKAGIKIWSIHLPFSRVFDISTLNDEDRNNMIRECSDMMALCKPLNPQKYVIHASAEPISDQERADRLRNSIASLKILNETAKQQNAQLAVECLPRTCLGNTAAELLSIVNEVGNGIGIGFDSNHLLQEKPEEFVAKVGNKITTVHMSDYDGLDERHWLPGTGIINWTNVVAELVKSGYKGPFMFEASRRKPASEGLDPSKLTAKELYSSFQEIKANYINSIN